MAVRTREEYIESLRRQRPKVYMAGEKVDNIVDHPAFQAGINNAAVTFELGHDPKYQELATVMSPLIGERISRYTQVYQDEGDAIATVKLARGLADYLCPCSYRCLTSNQVNAAWALSYDIDQKHNTEYHQRVVNIVEEIQRNDWILGGSSIDPKGDRSLSPGQQLDPDMYVRVVERRKDGIVLRGAKANSTAAPYTNMVGIIPTGRISEAEKDYCVACFTPVDAEGMTFICRPPNRPPEPKELENPFSSKHGGHVECMLVLDDVFVPWERVFMCGEYEFAPAFARMRNPAHAMHKCMCRWVGIDLAIGATALIADYNGLDLEKAPHIWDYIVEMIMSAEIMYSCALSSAMQGSRHGSGVYFPKAAPASAGKVYGSKKIGEEHFWMQDAAGGLVATMAPEEDFQNPETAKILEKYYQGRQGVPTEHRIRAIKLIEDLIASDFAAWYQALCISGGGPPLKHKNAVMEEYDLEESKRKAMIAAGIVKK